MPDLYTEIREERARACTWLPRPVTVTVGVVCTTPVDEAAATVGQCEPSTDRLVTNR